MDCVHLKTNKLTVLCCRMSKLCNSFTVSVRLKNALAEEAGGSSSGAGLQLEEASRTGKVTFSEGMGRNNVHLFPAKREERSLGLAVQGGRALHRIPDECFFCPKLI